MSDRIRRTRSATYEHTISGLLTKRSDLATEAAGLRDRLVEIRADIEAMDRVLRSLGHTGDIDATMPPKRREAIFRRGELSRAILDVLREAAEPMTTRQIAARVLASAGQDASGRALMPSQIRNVSKALGHLSASGTIAGQDDERNMRTWALG